MNIVHFIPYVSEDGAFGGPVAVAVAQTTELAKRGHTVKILGGWDGRGRLNAGPVAVDLIRARSLFRRRLSTLWSSRLLWRIFRLPKSSTVLHVHMGRDFLSLGAAALYLLRGGVVVAQTHGMITPKSSLMVNLYDRMFTRHILRRSSAVLALTERETLDLRIVGGDSVHPSRINNGVSPSTIVTKSKSSQDVLFLARLHPRKRVLDFAAMAVDLHQKLPYVRFAVVGPDEGDLDDLKAFIVSSGSSDYLAYEGALGPGDAYERIARSTVYVLPSEGEVFPMTVLEALAVGTPVVTTWDSGLAPLLSSAEAAVLTDSSASSLGNAVYQIMTDRALAAKLARNGRQLVKTELSAARVAERLEGVYSAT